MSAPRGGASGGSGAKSKGQKHAAANSRELSQIHADTKDMYKRAALKPIQTDNEANKWVMNARQAGMHFDVAWIREMTSTSLRYVCAKYQSLKSFKKFLPTDEHPCTICKSAMVICSESFYLFCFYFLL